VAASGENLHVLIDDVKLYPITVEPTPLHRLMH
jgi:hypothetical protein